jgi:hypothetical protein
MKSRIAPLVISAVSAFNQIVSLFVRRRCPLDALREMRIRVYQSQIVQYATDFGYSVSVAILVAASSSYVTFPLVIYFVWSNLCLVTVGREILPRPLYWVGVGYSLAYSFFSYYMASDVGSVFPVPHQLLFHVFNPDVTNPLTIVFSLVLAWSCMELMTAPGWTRGVTRPVPEVLKFARNVLVFCAYLGIFVYSLAFPSLVSIFWMTVVFFASFNSLPMNAWLFFPFLGVLFILSFVVLGTAQYEGFHLFGYSRDVNGIILLQIFGLFKLPENQAFTFELSGYIIVTLLGQIGRIQSRRSVATIADPVERQIDRVIASPLAMAGFYAALGGSVVIALYGGFFANRYAFQILAVVYLVVVLLSLYVRPVFEFLKFITGFHLLICTYYKAFDVQDCLTTNECMPFGSFIEMMKSGLVPHSGERLIDYVWVPGSLFLVNVFLSRKARFLTVAIPQTLRFLLCIGIAILQCSYTFAFKISLFSLVYLLAGIAGFAGQIMQLRWLEIATVLVTGLSGAVQLCLYLQTHLGIQRNFLGALFAPEFVDLRHIIQPTLEMFIIGLILFLNSMVLRLKRRADAYDSYRKYLVEAVDFFREFYHYIAWGIMFGFSVAHSYPTLIKFAWVVAFSICCLLRRPVRTLPTVVIVVLLIHIFCQYLFAFFWRNGSERFVRVCSYIGVYFQKEENQFGHRIPLAFCLTLVIISIMARFREGIQHYISPEFEQLIVIRIYRAVYALSHRFLPIFVDLMLFIATMYNPSIFGWFSFCVLVISVTKNNFMENQAGVVGILFVICFLVQYLLFLGYPGGIFADHDCWAIVTSDTKRYRWFLFFGIYDVELSAMLSNFLCAWICLFSRQFWKSGLINSQQRFQALPFGLRRFVQAVTGHIYEITVAAVVVIGAIVR